MPRPLPTLRALVPAFLAVAAARADAQLPGQPASPAGADSGRRLALSGIVYDSVAAAPLAGALLQLSDPADPTRALSVITDSLGRYRLDAVRPGRYLVGFIHQALDVLGLETPTLTVQVVGDTAARLDLAVPGPGRVRRAVCGPSAWVDSSAMLVGLARDAESDAAAEDAQIVLTWQELEFASRQVRMVPRHVTVPVQSGGRFVACGVPVDADITAFADAPGRRSGVVELRPERYGIHRRDFTLGPVTSSAVPGSGAAEATGTATLGGAVVGPDGRGVDGARVIVVDAKGSAETRDDGTFAMAGLPSGTYTVEARALGYTPVRAAVDLSSQRPARVRLVLDRRAPTLERVVVKGKARAQSRFVDEFLERRRTNAFGKYVTEADIEKRNAPRVTDVLRTVPGLQILPAPRTGYVVRGRGGCVPMVFLNGMAVQMGADDLDMIIPPNAVMGLEVYTGIGAIPAQYSNTSNNCGAILVWSK